jgi:hypothetical protein
MERPGHDDRVVTPPRPRVPQPPARHAVAALPTGQAEDLLADITEHLDTATDGGTADEATVRSAIDRLGSPDEVVAAALGSASGGVGMASTIARLLSRQVPAIHVDAFKRDANVLTVNPVCLTADDGPRLCAGLKRAIEKAGRYAR